MAAVSAIGIIAVPELGALYFGPKLYRTGVQTTHRPGSLRNKERERANQIMEEDPASRATVFDAYRLSSFNAIREKYIELDRLGLGRKFDSKRNEIESEITKFEVNIKDLNKAQNTPGHELPLMMPDYYNLVVPKPSWRYRAVDACSKLVGLIPNLTGLFAIYFNTQNE